MADRLRQLAALATVAAITVVVAVSPLWRGLQGTAQYLALPIMNQWASLTGYVGSLANVGGKTQHNGELATQLAQCLAQQTANQVASQEAGELKLLAALPTPPGYAARLARIVSQRNDETGARYVVDRGSADGLVAGLPVVAGVALTPGAQPSGVLVGIVDEVSEHLATFTPITSPLTRVAAEVVGVPGASGVAVGEYNLAVRLQLIPSQVALAQNAAVVTSHLNELVPPGLLIGLVTSVEQAAGEFFQSAVVAPAAALDRFHTLTVLIRS